MFTGAEIVLSSLASWMTGVLTVVVVSRWYVRRMIRRTIVAELRQSRAAVPSDEIAALFRSRL